MLVLSVFSFIGLSGIQSLSYMFDGSKIDISLTLEEESETKTNEESEIKSEKEIVNHSFAIEEQNHSVATAFQNHLFSLSNPVFEVATPPPRA